MFILFFAFFSHPYLGIFWDVIWAISHTSITQFFWVWSPNNAAEAADATKAATMDIRTPNLEKLSNGSLVEGLSDEGVTSQKYLNMGG